MNRDTLTIQEQETLRLICEGRTNAEIAERYCRSRATIDDRIIRLYAVFGISASRRQRSGQRVRLAMMAVALGLVSATEAVSRSTNGAPATPAPTSRARGGR